MKRIRLFFRYLYDLNYYMGVDKITVWDYLYKKRIGFTTAWQLSKVIGKQLKSKRMKLQDYLHYYLHGKIWEAGVMTCTLIGIGDSYYTIKTKQGTLLTLSNRANIKLVLRRLEDMMADEAIELASLVVHKDEYINVSIYRHNYTNDLMVQWGLLTQSQRADDVEYFFNATGERSWSGSQFHYLLQQGFDLFGLIDAGLAIDAKTLQS
jgi:hypothetical protein